MANLAENILASSIVLLAFLVIIALGYSFFVWRASSKKAGTTSEFLKNLHAGQKVKTNNGMYGVVKDVKKETVDVEFAPNVVITLDRWALISVPNNK